MKISHKIPRKTADISSARGTNVREFWTMVLSAIVLLIAIYMAIGFTVNYVVSLISFETEAKLFKHLQPTESVSDKEADQDDIKRVNEILNKLKSVEKVPPLPYRLVLMEDERPNAFAFPGGTIGVTTGLMDVLKEEIEIAFVIGHELGHFYHRDHLRGIGRAAGFGIFMTIVFNVGSGAESFGNIISFVLQRSYSQERELKADEFGLELVYSVYGNVEGTQHLFKILLENKDIPGWAYMFSTHPSPKQRIYDLEKFALELSENPDT